MNQLKVIWGMVVTPRSTLRALPYDKFFIVSFLISFSISGNSATGYFFSSVSDKVGPVLAVVFIISICALAFLIGGCIFTLFLFFIFGKQLTLKKVLNILGYSQAPRFIVAAVVFLLLAILPAEFKSNLLSGIPNNPSVLFAVIASGSILVLYTVFLMIWGFIVSPDVRELQQHEAMAAEPPASSEQSLDIEKTGDRS